MSYATLNTDFRLDKTYPHNRIKRAGGRLVYDRGDKYKYSRPSDFKPHWLMVVHVPYDNGDGGVVYRFVRNRRGWKCYGIGRLRYAGPLEQEAFAEHVPTYGPRQVERRDDGKTYWVDIASGEIVGEYTYPKAS